MYQASIKNVTRGTWLMSETHGKIRYTKDADKRLIFHDENDAEETLILVDDYTPDCHVLCLE